MNKNYAGALFLCCLGFISGTVTMKILDKNQIQEEPLWEDENGALPLGIIHKGDPFPAWAMKVTSKNKNAATAGSDFVGFLTKDNHVVLRSLYRLNKPCGYPDPLDPGPENHYYPCNAVIDIHGNDPVDLDGMGTTIATANSYDKDYFPDAVGTVSIGNQ